MSLHVGPFLMGTATALCNNLSHANHHVEAAAVTGCHPTIADLGV